MVKALNWYIRFTLGQDAILNMEHYLSIFAIVIMLASLAYRRRVGIADNGTL